MPNELVNKYSDRLKEESATNSEPEKEEDTESDRELYENLTDFSPEEIAEEKFKKEVIEKILDKNITNEQLAEINKLFEKDDFESDEDYLTDEGDDVDEYEDYYDDEAPF